MTSTLNTARIRPRLKLDAVWMPEEFTEADLPALTVWAVEHGADHVEVARSMQRAPEPRPGAQVDPEAWTTLRITPRSGPGLITRPGMWLVCGSTGKLFTVTAAVFEAEYELA